jgi:hypothetical protein
VIRVTLLPDKAAYSYMAGTIIGIELGSLFVMHFKRAELENENVAPKPLKCKRSQ